MALPPGGFNSGEGLRYVFCVSLQSMFAGGRSPRSALVALSWAPSLGAKYGEQEATPVIASRAVIQVEREMAHACPSELRGKLGASNHVAGSQVGTAVLQRKYPRQPTGAPRPRPDTGRHHRVAAKTADPGRSRARTRRGFPTQRWALGPADEFSDPHEESR